MFTDPKPKSKLQIEIDRLVLELDDHTPTSEKYGEIVERLSKLHKIQADRTPDLINKNTVITTVAHLIGVVMIIRHEHLNVITTKALGFIPKIR